MRTLPLTADQARLAVDICEERAHRFNELIIEATQYGRKEVFLSTEFGHGWNGIAWIIRLGYTVIEDAGGWEVSW